MTMIPPYIKKLPDLRKMPNGIASQQTPNAHYAKKQNAGSMNSSRQMLIGNRF